MRVISTEATDWQQHCWDLASAGTAFEIHNATATHVLFSEEVCGAHEGRYLLRGGSLQLTFPSWKK